MRIVVTAYAIQVLPVVFGHGLRLEFRGLLVAVRTRNGDVATGKSEMSFLMFHQREG